uniref:Plasmid replication protein RepL domain-containing protein n=1 Tax=uncultured prokaryote TaxID=198431 RepID=A0A0H5PYZ9_9ZZZZ|nr:hypothetical protein [uncultured prokaryote]
MKRLEQHRMKTGEGRGRTVETIDPSTGEVLKGVFAFVPEKSRSPFGKDWFAMAQDAMGFLARNRRFLGEEGFAVFFSLASKLDFENYILVNQADVGRDLTMDRANVNKAIKKLESLGVLTKGPKSGVSPTFKLNPVIGWKGKQRQHFNALQVARKQGWNLIEGGKEKQLDLPL